jgi:hypothetical protein
MRVPMPYGLSMGKRRKPMTKPGSKVWPRVWMGPLHSCVYCRVHHRLQLIRAYFDRRVVFGSSHFVPCPKYSEFASQPRGAIGILPAVGRNAGPDLPANRIHHPTGSNRIHPPPPYPTFRPSSSDIRVNIYWSIGLVCSLSAGVLAILIRQWARSYMQAFQRYDHPLKKARFRQFFFEGTKGMRNLAEVVPG